ncbi:hypothetical protein GF336_01505 [Candidatus Woesearchaeota archaeon]|nr:hypothetical protein [Candidatus Woesearchaeota archaeon]
MGKTIDTKLKPEDFLNTLEKGERGLIKVNDSIYNGKWNDMLKDLKNRQQQKPYSTSLHKKITRDIAIIERIQAYEKAKNVALTYNE